MRWGREEGRGRGRFARWQYRSGQEGAGMLNRPSLLLLIVPFLAAPPAAGAQRLERTPAHPTRDQIEAQLGYRTGRVTLPGGLATLDLPADFRYLDAEDTEIVLRAWGNPPGAQTLGMVVPTALRVLTPEGWGVIITYEIG